MTEIEEAAPLGRANGRGPVGDEVAIVPGPGHIVGREVGFALRRVGPERGGLVPFSMGLQDRSPRHRPPIWTGRARRVGPDPRRRVGIAGIVSITPRRIDGVRRHPSRAHRFGRGEQGAGDGLGAGLAGLVRGDADRRVVPERVGGRQRLGSEDVERGAGEVSGFEGGQEVGGVFTFSGL